MTIPKNLSIWVVIFAVTVFLNPFSMSFAAAQEEEKPKEAARGEKTDEEYKLEPTTVTAQKREENVQDVPASITVFSDIELEDAGIENTLELTRFTPNVYMKKSTSENMISIRGVDAFDTSIYSPTGLYVDDVSFPLHYMHNLDLFDVERVEVLKGPQGTLYGRNSEAGVINIITKQPGNEIQGKIQAGYGFYDTPHDNAPIYHAGVGISGPIARDKLYLGLAGQWAGSDGFTKNVYNDDDEAAKTDHKNGRATLRWTPTGQWDISFIADITDNDDKIGVYRFSTGQYETERYQVNIDGEFKSREKGNGQTLRIRYQGDSFNLLSVTGLRNYKNENAQDYDVTADPMNDWGTFGSVFKDTQISQELRITSPENNKPLKWLAGLYGFTEETDIDQDNPTLSERRQTKVDIKSYALFAEGTYTLFNKLHLTAGLRYDYLESEGKQDYDYLDPVTWMPQSSAYEKNQDNNEFLPKFSVSYDLSEDILSYIVVSKGYLVGGYNYTIATDKASFSYDPEYTWNYEIGVKTSWLDNKLMANLSAFYIDMKDKQFFEQSGGATPSTKVSNAARAHSQGFELELQARPARGLDLFAGFGYAEAKFDEWIATEWNSTYTALVENDYKDKYIPNVPRYTYNIGMQYRHNSGIFGRVDVMGIGKFYGDPANTVKEDAYNLVNLRLGYEAEVFDIILWGKNVFDKGYETIKYDWDGSELVQDGEPASFGVTVNYRF